MSTASPSAPSSSAASSATDGAAAGGRSPAAAARLITIPISHYCEKARWGLERANVAFREEGHVPIAQALVAKRTGGKRTVPVLVHAGQTLTDSTDILAFADARLSGGEKLYPEDPALGDEVRALEDRFDEVLGPHVRRFAYFHMLPHRALCLAVLRRGTPWLERAALTAAFPVGRLLMRRLLAIDAAGAERSRQKMRTIFDEVDARLADGRAWLVGDRFTAADLTLAALAAPVVSPPEHPFALPPLDRLPGAFARVIEEIRARPVGALVLRAYREQRR